MADGVKLAVLIDTDNVQPAFMEPLLAKIAELGEASVLRAYRDWGIGGHAAWNEVMLVNGIHPVQQPRYVGGKNASDIALVIDAMDLLYSRSVDGFCLISSDSDFTRLAIRIREAGLLVHGFGEEKTPVAFRAACHSFSVVVAIDQALPQPTTRAVAASSPKPPPAKPVAPKPKPPSAAQQKASALQQLAPKIRLAFDASRAANGIASANAMQAWVLGNEPAFKPASVGHNSFSAVLNALKSYELTVIKGSPNRKRDQQVRLRK